MESRDINDPGHPPNKHRTRESQRQLRELLMDWDVIGVAGLGGAADEYDCMLSPLIRQLHDGADEAQIREWLSDEVEDHFGLSTEPDREAVLAGRIVVWWRRRSAESATGQA